MEAPKCKLCGERHYGLCQPVYPSSQHELQSSANKPAKPLDARSSPMGEGTKPKYDRNAAHRTYMKKYMRKRRAKDKGK